MFIKVQEEEYNDVYIINTDNISYIYETTNTILVNGIHGGGNSFLRLNDESIKKILDNIEII